VIFADLITLLILVLIAALIAATILIPLTLLNHFLTGAPFVWPAELPMNVHLPVFFVCFVIIFLFVMSDVRLRPFSIRRILSEMPVGLRVNSGRILEYIASMAFGLVLVGSGTLEILYEDIRHGIIANGFAGLLLGSAFAHGALEKDFVLGNLYRIGRARCLIRLDRQTEASYRIKRLGDSPKFSRPPPVEYLVIALLNLIEGFPRIEEYLNEAATESVSTDEYHRYREIIADSILRTRRLAGLSDDSGLVRKMIRRNYLGIGRVLRTGYSYMDGVDPSEYDPDNPTGYMTGQWIDVEVIEGKMYFNKWFSPKEIIRGIWSYGGDVGIVGKPREGDLVGYYEQEYAKVWEKISDNSIREHDE